jgi:uncharacterized protein YndB with AHSA1/START domain
VIRDGKVVHVLELPVPPAEVFSMFVDPKKLVRWIGIGADLEPRPGGRFRFEVQPGQFCEGEYLVLEPPRRLVFSWGWTDPWFGLPPGFSRVEVELEDLAGATRLHLVHDQLPGEMQLLHDEGWSAFLGRLAAVVGGRDPRHYPEGDPRDRQRELRRGGSQA